MTSEFYHEHLRPFPAELEELRRDDIPLFGSLPDLFRSFEQATGFHLRFQRGNNHPLSTSTESFLQSSDHEMIFPVTREQQVVVGFLHLLGVNLREEKGVIRWVMALAATVGELYQWADTVRKNEAELAIHSLHVVARNEKSPESFARTLRHILSDGTKIVDCHAAALYLLDQETTSLRLRVCCGLPEESLNAPPRPLKGALADLEALLGNAVILNELYLTDSWKSPESFATAICVPVCSDDAMLGTIWFYSDDKRNFSNRELSILEMTAGRIASELEKVYLQREFHQLRPVEN